MGRGRRHGAAMRAIAETAGRQFGALIRGERQWSNRRDAQNKAMQSLGLRI